MRLPDAVHRAHPWLIDAIAPDFDLLDVWALPVTGHGDDFPAFVDTVASLNPAQSGSAATRALFSLRRRLGQLLGWDDARTQRPIPGAAETTLRARLPEDLRDSAVHAGRPVAGAFTPLYQTDVEWAAELANDTVHGVLHLSWVADPAGGYRGRLAVYVKPRGRLGSAYLALIQPFRHLIVYPALTRQVGRAWRARTTEEA